MDAYARAAIASAASNGGVNCSPYYTQTSNPLAAFVRLASSTRDESGFGFMDTVEVWVVLSQDVRAAEEQLDELLPGLLAALQAELVVTTVTPSQLTFKTGTVNGVVVAGTRPA